MCRLKGRWPNDSGQIANPYRIACFELFSKRSWPRCQIQRCYSFSIDFRQLSMDQFWSFAHCAMCWMWVDCVCVFFSPFTLSSAYWGRDPSAAAANPLFGAPFGAGMGMLPTGASNANDRFAMGHQQQQQQQVNWVNHSNRTINWTWSV